MQENIYIQILIEDASGRFLWGKLWKNIWRTRRGFYMI